MKSKVYLESSVISYLTGKPSRDLVIAARQQLTQEWWNEQREAFDVYISSSVINEIGSGDPSAATERLRAIQGIPLVAITTDLNSVTKSLIAGRAVPANAAEDAVHIALAAINGMDYLLTWNCKHIANASVRRAIEAALLQMGYSCPTICTPEELLGELEL